MYNKGWIISRAGGVLTMLAIVLCTCTANCPTTNDVSPFDLNQVTYQNYIRDGDVC